MADAVSLEIESGEGQGGSRSRRASLQSVAYDTVINVVTQTEPLSAKLADQMFSASASSEKQQ